MACVRGLNCCEKQKNMGRHEKALRFSAHTVGIFGFLCEENYWPDYKEEDFLEALEWYQRQDVTLGG